VHLPISPPAHLVLFDDAIRAEVQQETSRAHALSMETLTLELRGDVVGSLQLWGRALGW
jgi:hypothetical protein